MSRTYRLRNLPVLPGHARKYYDAAMGYRRREEEDEIYDKLAHEILGLPCVKNSKRKYGSHRWCIWRATRMCYTEVEELFKAVENGKIYNLASVSNHPWVKWYEISKMKSYYKRTGNRKNRRRTRQMLHSQTIDEDWEGSWPNKNEGWSMWDLY